MLKKFEKGLITVTIDNSDISNVIVPLDLEMMYGNLAPVWYPEYFYNFMGSSFSRPAEILGLGNVKYLISSQEEQREVLLTK